ncbi:sulfatase-like hydrolase/transferase [Thalassotalea ponticola]|uniref:sulfatase-like hydrolase/transferase n=1 Tax=Thalassotalea ponticola TaxID=1523392 RepID=UPI0025B4B0A4|nr:sulfatase-like hydrolase/transferase [Thalassotalea ponticola]MDN3651737.1 sulfatase-like hydrolase/transferase [Thalassotalea ponticola]
MITIKRTFFRTLALIALFSVCCLAFRSSLQPISNFSILTLLSNEKVLNLINFAVIIEVIIFVTLFIVINVVWAYVITVSCKCFFNKLSDDSAKTLVWFNICSLHFLTVLAVNAYVSPTSLLGILRTSWLSSIPLITFLTTTILVLFVYNVYKYHTKRQAIIWCALLCLFLTPPFFYTPENKFKSDKTPNIIIIGVDALRPDHLAHKGFKHNLLPNLNKFLTSAEVFDKTYTVFPRTYVSWLSLLKSQYPISHGGRFNLTPDNLVNKNIPFINTIKNEGYNTTWALDERRFNSIDTSYGFDNIVGPKLGITDNLINSASDLPILNILTNTRFGYYFLPFINMNRAVGRTFEPDSFNDAALEQLSPTQANFLAIHFCMLHWPYTSQNFIEVNEDLWQGNHTHFMYQSLLPQVDNQFADLMNKLNSKGYLDNALVYVVSDHGESFALDKDKMTTNVEYIKSTSHGHGTNVLDHSQSQILLAFAKYEKGQSVSKSKIHNGLFSNLDIIPTIAKQVDIEIEQTEGRLLPIVSSIDSEENYIYVESSLPMKSLNNSDIDVKSVIYNSIGHYTVNEQGHSVVKEESYQEILGKIHRSILYKNWQLALIPELNQFVIVDITERHISVFDDYDGKAPKHFMKEKLCSHYKPDIDKYFPAICSP